MSTSEASGAMESSAPFMLPTQGSRSPKSVVSVTIATSRVPGDVDRADQLPHVTNVVPGHVPGQAIEDLDGYARVHEVRGAHGHCRGTGQKELHRVLRTRDAPK